MATIKLKKGAGAPSSLNLAEPALDLTNNALYVGITGGVKWVGAEIDNSTALGTSQIKIPTQFAVKTYVDNNVAAGAVGSVNGLTGAVFIGTGTGIGLAVAGKGITLTNTGVQSIAGTANQITASGSTGAVTLSLPSAVTMPGSLTVTGDLTVNGTTTYVNSTVTEIADPIITLGWTGGVGGMPIDDNKDRGIAFKYNSGGGKTGFFGYDDSTGYFTFVPVAGITSEVVGGTVGTANFAGVISNVGVTLSLTADGNASDSIVNLVPAQMVAGTARVDVLASAVRITNPDGQVNTSGMLDLQGTDGTNFARLQPASLSALRTFTLPDHTGTVVAPSDLGTSGYILKANGTTSQPTWINANAAGFTAYAAQEVVGGAAGNLLYQSAANVTSFVTNAGITGTVLTYNTATNLPTFANPNTAGFTAYGSTVAVNLQGGAAGSLPYNTAASTTSFLSIGTANFVLTSSGSAPQWTNANAAGFTAFTSANINIASEAADTTCYLAFVNTNSDSNQALKYNSSLSYNAATNYLEANIDGGTY
jgi:hypothetical protein